MLTTELTSLSDEIKNEPQGTHGNTKTRIAAMFQSIINSIGRRSVFVEDFGQIGVGNDTAVIQSAVNYCIANAVKVLNFRATTYTINGPIICSRIVADAYTSFNLDLVGSVNANAGVTGQCTRISCTHTDTFGIGFQNARSCTVSNILIVGARAENKSSKQIFESDITDWTISGVRDTQYSPYAGIVVDPFGSSAPSDGGYPGLSSYYKASAAGSSGVSVRNCYISNFTVGFLISPNGTTANAESINVYNSRIYLSKIAWASGQSQTRNCRLVDSAIFYALNAIDTISYGAGTGSQAVIDSLIISKVRNCFNISTSRGNMDARFVYAEDIWKIGVVIGAKTANFSNCTFKFNWGENSEGNILAPDSLVSGGGYSYFNNCDFTKPGDSNWNANFSNQISYFNGCIFDCKHVPFGDVNLSKSYVYGFLASSESRLTGATPSPFYNFHGSVARKLGNTNTTFLEHQIKANGNSSVYIADLALTVSGNEATFTPADTEKIAVGDVILSTSAAGLYFLDYTNNNSTTATIDNSPVLGTVKSISGGVVTIKDLRFKLTSGTYPIYSSWSNRYFGGIVGTATNGSNVITNVYKESGSSLVGQRIYNSDPAHFPFGLYVVSEDTNARTLTLSGNLNANLSTVFLYTAFFTIDCVVSVAPSTITNLYMEKGTVIRSKGVSLTNKLYICEASGIVGNSTHAPVFKEVSII